MWRGGGEVFGLPSVGAMLGVISTVPNNAVHLNVDKIQKFEKLRQTQSLTHKKTRLVTKF